MNYEHKSVKTFVSNEELSQVFSEQIATRLRQAIQQRGRAYLVVSGGNTPKPLFEKLSRIDLDWAKVTILLADERWVLPDSSDSNDKLVKTLLLKNNAGKASYISLFTGHEKAANAALVLSSQLNALPTFDVVVLGMGDDGHTASLFPDCAELEQGLQGKEAVIATHPAKAPYARVSLTKSRLLNSRNLYFHFCGENKLKVFKEVESQGETTLPIGAFLQQQCVPTEVYYAA
ncbi:6-phosphogluconolactonase [Idiomarina seosinensis]|uniref:6-phosphogluconolactonase n=1 Tax=Idiomarina seosinensis TaxID=281739 RepID=UPI003850DCBF